MDLRDAARKVSRFQDPSLTTRLASLERDFIGTGPSAASNICANEGLGSDLLRAAFELKTLAGQINVVIHASGILAALPSILTDTEVIEYLSLGAGNTGRTFDLETSHRVAEFKFINWRGGAESIRQNLLFKDFYFLAEHDTGKLRCLYVLGLAEPLKFLQGGRSLSSVMSRNAKMARVFKAQYGSKFRIVSEYYNFRRERVQIIDLIPILPELAGQQVAT